jgi:hypothetical protein
MERMVIKLECPVCHRIVEPSMLLRNEIVDFNADQQCCDVWMWHKNKRIESEKVP